MLLLLCYCYCLCEFPTVETKEFTPELQRSVLAATVRVVVDDGRKATGVLVGVRDGFGYLLTAHHAVEKSGKIEVQFFTAESHPKPSATVRADLVVFENPAADLALLKVSLKVVAPVPIPIRAEGPKEKEFIALSGGASGGKAPTPQVVHVRGRKLVQRADGGGAFFWQTREASVEGRSGGPLVDATGCLVGIASGEQQSQGYFGHLDEIRAWLRKADDGKLRWLLEVKKPE
jgi:S1-C subfamily serine protease